jgi:hypothetical protein
MTNRPCGDVNRLAKFSLRRPKVGPTVIGILTQLHLANADHFQALRLAGEADLARTPDAGVIQRPRLATDRAYTAQF